MALEQTTLDIITARIIRELLDEGVPIDVFIVQRRVEAFLEANNLDEPSFTPEDFEVISDTSSSASLYNNTNQFLGDDLGILYRNMFLLSNDSMRTFDRWRTQFSQLEAQLDDLEDRVSNLLIVTQDTEGFFNFVSDVFSDTSKTDLENSSIVLDLGREQISIGANDPGATRVSLNLIKPENISFVVLTQQNLQAVVLANGGDPINAFVDTSKFWQHRVHMTRPDPVVAELLVKVGDSPVTVSRITFKVHSANANASIKITPLVSIDGINFAQLATDGFEQSVVNKATFTFPPTAMSHIKFILAKDGFDHIDGLLYVYEFGADDIAFYQEGFLEDTGNVFISQALSVTNTDGSLATFNRCSLNVCDLIPLNTEINYFVAAENNIPLTISGLNFVPIDPLERETPINPVVVNFTDLTDFEVGNTTVSGEFVRVSYDATNPSSLLINPGPDFKLIDVSTSGVSITSASTTGLRYALPTNNNRILDHQVLASVNFKDNNITIFRNFGIKGDKDRVRNIQAGWGFIEPNYTVTIEVENSTGVNVDFGGNNVTIDGVVANGDVLISQGIHVLEIHESNWIDVENTATTEDELIALDPIYPHNHKLLIEGYPYPVGFTGAQVYPGMDLFAELRLSEVSPFDIFRSVVEDDLSKFALDLDAKDGARDPSRVIIVKTDASNPDFISERFVIRIKVNTSALSFRHIWLKADLSTTDPEVAPILDSYRIRLGR